MWVVFCALYAIKFQLITSLCVYHQYDFDYPPVFTQAFGSSEFILKSNQHSLQISEGSYVKAYCDTNFSTPIFDQNSVFENPSIVEVKCSKGVLLYVTDNRVVKVENTANLGCHGSQPSFYVYGENSCQRHSLLAYGLEVNHKQIVLANFCYDTDKEEISYIHYESGDRSSKLKDWSAAQFYENLNMPINFIGSNKQRTAELNFYFCKNGTKDQNMCLYKFDQLVPADRLLKGFTSSPEILEGLNSIPWWTGLKESNWKLFETLLEKRTISKKCDIYTGVLHFKQFQEAKDSEQQLQRQSEELQHLQLQQYLQRQQHLQHMVKTNEVPSPQQPRKLNRQNITIDTVYPYNWRNKRSYCEGGINENDLHLMADYYGKTIPLFVWTYVKPRNSNDEAVVVIAINSPLVQLRNYGKLLFCADNCKQFEWLRKLETAKMPSMGYIFCCPPEEARKYIRNLP